jgi:hypothetical protein
MSPWVNYWGNRIPIECIDKGFGNGNPGSC